MSHVVLRWILCINVSVNATFLHSFVATFLHVIHDDFITKKADYFSPNVSHTSNMTQQ